MSTNFDLSRTGTAPLADRLTTSLLAVRATLPPERNGKPPRSRSPRAAYLLNEIGAGRMKPFHAIDDVMDACLADGVPLSEFTGLLDQWRASLEARAVARFLDRRTAVPLPTLLRTECVKETVAQGRADVAQMRAACEPENVVALEAFARDGERHRAELGVLLTVTRQTIEVVRGGQSPRIYGAPRPAMELSR